MKSQPCVALCLMTFTASCGWNGVTGIPHPWWKGHRQQDGLSYTLLGIDPFAMPLQPGAGAGFKADDVRRLLTEPGTVIVAGDGIRVADIATVQGSSPLPVSSLP